MLKTSQRSFFILFIAICFLSAACERIPEWERKTALGKRDDQSLRLLELRKWIWTCRANVSPSSRDKNSRAERLGPAIEEFRDFFRVRGLSSLDASGAKTILGSALLWSESGVLVSWLPWFEEVSGIECSNGSGNWLEARLKGSDKGLDLAVLEVTLPASMQLKAQNRWLTRSDSLKPTDSDLTLLSSAIPGQLDRFPVSFQPFASGIQTGIDDKLIFFLPSPPRISSAAVLVDSSIRVIGLLLPNSSSAWGVAVSASYLEEIVSTILKKGTMLRAYAGFRARFQPDRGFVIQQIDVGGPAHQAGLRVDDVLIKWYGHDLKTPSDWTEITPDSIGRSIGFAYQRGQKIVETQLSPIASD